MIYKNSILEKTIDLNEVGVINIVIENDTLLQKVISSFVNEDTDEFNELFINNDEVLFSKFSEVMFYPLSLDMSGKVLINKFYDSLIKIDKFQKDVDDINVKIAELLKKININSDIKVDFDIDYSLKDYFGFGKLHYKYDGDYLQYFVDSLKVYSTILGKKVFVFFNLYFYFNSEQISFINKEVSLVNASLINICKVSHSNKNIEEIIIDKDLCEI